MMVISREIQSLMYIALGIACIVLFASKLLLELLFMLFGLYLINRGLSLRGVSPSSFVMRMWMGRFR